MVLRCKQLQKENTGPWTHRVFMAVITVMILVGLNMPIITYGALVLSLLYILLCDGEDCMEFMFYLLPFGNIFKSNPAGTSFFTYLTIFLALKLFLSQRRLKVKFLIMWVVVLAIQIIGSLGDYKILIKQAALLLLIYGYFQCCNPRLKSVVMSLSTGLLVSCSIACFFPSLPGLEQYMRVVRAYEVSADIFRFTGMYTDPNYLSLALTVCIAAVYCLMRKKQIGAVGWFICGGMVFFGILSISKSFFLILAIALLLFIADAVRNRRVLFMTLLSIAMVIVTVLVAQNIINVFDNVFERLFNAEDITTGRTDLLDQYIRYFIDNPLNLVIGSGVAAPPLSGLPHNTYVDFLYYYGMFGTVFFMMALYYAVSPLKAKKTALNTAPLICFAVMMMALSCVQMYDFAYILIIVSAVLKDEDPCEMTADGVPV